MCTSEKRRGEERGMDGMREVRKGEGEEVKRRGLDNKIAEVQDRGKER